MVQENLKQIKASIPEEVCLVAVSKTKPNELILEAYEAGHRDFGENKVQDLCKKYEELPKDIHWHFIGHLQTNKVKYIAPFVHLVHGVESVKLLNTIDKEGAKNNRVIDVLLQVKIASEESKFGLTPEDVTQIITSSDTTSLKNVRIVGLMGMSTNTDDEEQVKSEFQELRKLFDTIRTETLINNFSFNILSMGMSGDYNIAIEEGSTMVRIGSSIFGARNYAT